MISCIFDYRATETLFSLSTILLQFWSCWYCWKNI